MNRKFTARHLMFCRYDETVPNCLVVYTYSLAVPHINFVDYIIELWSLPANYLIVEQYTHSFMQPLSRTNALEIHPPLSLKPSTVHIAPTNRPTVVTYSCSMQQLLDFPFMLALWLQRLCQCNYQSKQLTGSCCSWPVFFLLSVLQQRTAVMLKRTKRTS